MSEQTSPLLSVDGLNWSVAGTPILANVSLQVFPGQFVGLLGPNGAGKSSLMRCIFRHCRPDTGSIRVNGKEVWDMRPRDLARQVAVILQEHSEHFGLTVRDVVSLGLIPHKGLFEWETQDDRNELQRILEDLDLANLAHAPFSHLSGGEKQRCMLARAMLQKPCLLLMDEPTNHLDVHYQIELLNKVRSLGLTVLASFHDLNLAAAFCDHLVVLNNGGIVASGTVKQVLNEDLITETFRTCALVDEHPLYGHPRISFAYHQEPNSER